MTATEPYEVAAPQWAHYGADSLIFPADVPAHLAVDVRDLSCAGPDENFCVGCNTGIGYVCVGDMETVVWRTPWLITEGTRTNVVCGDCVEEVAP